MTNQQGNFKILKSYICTSSVFVEMGNDLFINTDRVKDLVKNSNVI